MELVSTKKAFRDECTSYSNLRPLFIPISDVHLVPISDHYFQLTHVYRVSMQALHIRFDFSQVPGRAHHQNPSQLLTIVLT